MHKLFVKRSFTMRLAGSELAPTVRILSTFTSLAPSFLHPDMRKAISLTPELWVSCQEPARTVRKIKDTQFYCDGERTLHTQSCFGNVKGQLYMQY